MTDQEQAFLAAVIARPDDDLPRLVMADWLDERGESERAEFIRVQCELLDRECEQLEAGNIRCGMVAVWGVKPCHWCTLRLRERELRNVMLDTSTPTQRRLTRAAFHWAHQVLGRHVAVWPHAFRRGFIEGVALPWNYEHVAALRRVTPLRKCVLTTDPTGPDGLALGAGVDRVNTIRVLEAEFPGTTFELPS